MHITYNVGHVGDGACTNTKNSTSWLNLSAYSWWLSLIVIIPILFLDIQKCGEIPHQNVKLKEFFLSISLSWDNHQDTLGFLNAFAFRKI